VYLPGVVAGRWGWGKVGESKSFEHFGDVAWHRNGHAVFVERDVHPEV
jgi:hypothetical protein